MLYSGASNLINMGKQINEYTFVCKGDTLTLGINGYEITNVSETGSVDMPAGRLVPYSKPDASGICREGFTVLEAEQGHFDFARLLTLEFKKAIRSTILLKTNYTSKIDSIFNAILASIREMEIQYDKETDHMLNAKKQKLWIKKYKYGSAS